MSSNALTHRQKEWAYTKWCEGYTLAQLADALFVNERTVRRAMHGRPRIRPILKYEEGEKVPASNVVMVVRCKDCVFWNTKSKSLTDEHICRRFSCFGVCDNYTSANDYCSYGEIRERDNNA